MTRTRTLRRLAWIAVVLVTCVSCDQGTKSLAERTLAGHHPQSFLGGRVLLGYALNPGAFLSLGAGLSDAARFWIFTVFTAAALAVMLGLAAWDRKVGTTQALALSLVAGGGLGNLVDRVLHGGLVVDFMHVDVGLFRTGIFNVADMAIMAGAGLLVLTTIASRRTADRVRT